MIVNMVRGGPDLAAFSPLSRTTSRRQRRGHGDYRMLVLAPASVQELADCAADAFDLADKYRNPVMIMGDGALGQMMEPVTFSKPPVDVSELPPKPWATTGARGRAPNIVNSLYLENEELEKLNLRLQAKYLRMQSEDVRAEVIDCDDADVILVAYGTMSRICRSAANLALSAGLRVGIVRPVTLFPFPSEILSELAKRGVPFLVVELSLGQMVEDVRLAVNGASPVHFYGRTGGFLPTPREILARIESVLRSRPEAPDSAVPER